MTIHFSILAWEFHEQSYSPWGHKESDTTEQLTFSLSFISEKKLSFPVSPFPFSLEWMGLIHSHLCILQEFSSLENTQSASQMLKDGGLGGRRRSGMATGSLLWHKIPRCHFLAGFTPPRSCAPLKQVWFLPRDRFWHSGSKVPIPIDEGFLLPPATGLSARLE